MLKAVEVEELIESLENKNFKLTLIDSDSTRGELELVQYPDIVKIGKKLEKEGFSWNEKKVIKINLTNCAGMYYSDYRF